MRNFLPKERLMQLLGVVGEYNHKRVEGGDDPGADTRKARFTVQ